MYKCGIVNRPYRVFIVLIYYMYSFHTIVFHHYCIR